MKQNNFFLPIEGNTRKNNKTPKEDGKTFMVDSHKLCIIVYIVLNIIYSYYII